MEVAATSKEQNMGYGIHILDSPVCDAIHVVDRTSPPDSALSSIGTVVASGSSMHHKIYEILSAPNCLSDLGPVIFSRFREWIDNKEVTLCAAIKSIFTRPNYS